MDLLNRRSLLGFLLAASISVLQGTSAVSVAQEPVPTETSVPPVILDTKYCNWSVTCTDSNGNTTTASDTASGVTCDKAERKAENAINDYLSNYCSSATAPVIYMGSCNSTGGTVISEMRGHENPCPAVSPSMGGADWIVRFECTGRNGGSVAKEARGTTYCEALAKARAYVCRMINTPIYGGACRCCTRVIQRPDCCQQCVPGKKR